jgi:hypothetical protein
MDTTHLKILALIILLTTVLSCCSYIGTIDDDGFRRVKLEESYRWERGGVKSW